MTLPPDLAAWIGRESRAEDVVTPGLIARWRATLAPVEAAGAVPAGVHWALCPPLAAPDQLGRDGHPSLGLFLPPMPLPRRMWAGGRLRHRAPLARVTRVAEIAQKAGRSGALWFLTLHHDWQVAGETRIAEQQDLVFRADPSPDDPAAQPAALPAPDWPDAERILLTPDATLLFRFSALTFNGHRIHYDAPYSTGTEGYGGLVVHGPLQAVWMLTLATRILGGLPRVFTYRGRSPLIAGTDVAVEARRDGDGLTLRVRRVSDGAETMIASAL